MNDVRVFVGVAPQVPATVVAGGEVAPAGARVHLVTHALRSVFEQMEGVEADEEDMEYEAMWEAAGDCPGRPVVAALDVPAAQVTPEGGNQPSAALVSEALSVARLVSWHVLVDEEGTQGTAGADGADGEEEELSWYDATETAEVARLLG